MASVTSLGIHKPSAIPFLIDEGILPFDPPEHTYTWETGTDIGLEDGGYDEELLTTKHCVVWSRGGTIRRVYRLDVEGETVKKALFAQFPARSPRLGTTVNQVRLEQVREDKRHPKMLDLRKFYKLMLRSIFVESGKGRPHLNSFLTNICNSDEPW